MSTSEENIELESLHVQEATENKLESEESDQQDVDAKNNNPGYSRRSVAVGVGFAFGSNVINVACIITGRQLSVSPGETCLSKGILQLLIFLPIHLIRHRKSRLKCSTWAWAWTMGALVGAMTLGTFAAVAAAPASHFLAVWLAVPAITLFFSRCFLGSEITWLKLLSCPTLVLGVLLVLRPGFMFKDEEFEDENIVEDDEDWQVAVGAAISVACVFCAALVNIIVAKCRHDCPPELFMVTGAVGPLLLSLASIPNACNNDGPSALMSNRIFCDPGEMEASDWLVIIAIGAGLVAQALLQVQANRNAPPTIVTMIFSTSLILSVIVEVLFFGLPFSWSLLLGTVLAVASVAAFVFAADIEKWVKNTICCCCK